MASDRPHTLGELIAARGRTPATVAYTVHRRLSERGESQSHDTVAQALELLIAGSPVGWTYFFAAGFEHRGAALASAIDAPVDAVRELALYWRTQAVVVDDATTAATLAVVGGSSDVAWASAALASADAATVAATSAEITGTTAAGSAALAGSARAGHDRAVTEVLAAARGMVAMASSGQPVDDVMTAARGVMTLATELTVARSGAPATSPTPPAATAATTARGYGSYSSVTYGSRTTGPTRPSTSTAPPMASPSPPGPAASPPTASPAPGTVDWRARLLAAVRGALPRTPGRYTDDVVVGPPPVDALVLTERMTTTYVWLERDELHALGPRSDEVAARLAPDLTITAPPWYAAWRDLTRPGANPWSVADAAKRGALGPAFDVPPQPGCARGPDGECCVAIRATRAVAQWATGEQARLVSELTRDAGDGGWVMSGDPAPVTGQLARWATRAFAVDVPWQLPFWLHHIGRGPVVERTPRARELALDVLGDAGCGCVVRVRAIALDASPHDFTPVRDDPRSGLTIVNGGDVLLAVQPPSPPTRRAS